MRFALSVSDIIWYMWSACSLSKQYSSDYMFINLAETFIQNNIQLRKQGQSVPIATGVKGFALWGFLVILLITGFEQTQSPNPQNHTLLLAFVSNYEHVWFTLCITWTLNQRYEELMSHYWGEGGWWTSLIYLPGQGVNRVYKGGCDRLGMS